MLEDDEVVEGVELGKLLEIEIDGRLIEFPSRPPLYWLPQIKALFWSVASPRRQRSDTASRRQIIAYRRWHADEPQKGARIERYPAPKPSEWIELGQLRRIDYHSQKWGDSAEYTHKSRGGTQVYKSGKIWVAHGQMRLSNRGLIK